MVGWSHCVRVCGEAVHDGGGVLWKEVAQLSVNRVTERGE